MEWIVDPTSKVLPESCWVDFCGSFCGAQSCIGQDCSGHSCWVYLYDVEKPM